MGPLALGLLFAGCDDDDVVISDAGVDGSMRRADAGRADAGRRDAGRDAGRADASRVDAGRTAVTFTVPLTRAEEVPVCADADENAEGSATVMIDADDTTITVTDLTWTSLSGPATGAHIHFGAPGVAGPIVLDFGANPTSPINRTFTAADYPSPVPAGAPADFASFVEAMRDGETYINVHTEDCMSGEIRGQID